MSKACQGCGFALEEGDLRCPVCGLVTPEAENTNTTPALEVLRCHGCGAAVAYDIEAQAPRCGFCGSTMTVEKIIDPMEQTEGFLPLLVDTQSASQTLKKWLGTRGWFCPGDLLQAAKLESLKPLWWTGWVFDAEAVVSWAADSNAGANQADWAPHSGQVFMSFDNILVSASRGLSEEEVHALTPSYQLDTAAADSPRAPGAIIEQFDIQRSSARQQILDAIYQIAGERITNEEVPGSRFRNLSIEACLESLKTSRFAFPAYVLAYRYKDELFRAVVHGQDASVIIGKTPISWLRVALFILALTGIGLLAMFLLNQ